jgi:hypothetical protein
MAQCVDDVTNIIENDASQGDGLCERYKDENAVINDCNICVDCQCCERHSTRYINGLAASEKEFVSRIFPDLSDKDSGQCQRNQQCTCLCRHLFRIIIRSHMETH